MAVVGSINIVVGRIPAVPTAYVSSPKASATVSQTQSVQNTKPAASQSVDQNISAGLLWSVNQPSGSNHLATADYLAMRNDLNANNLPAAQEAYLRMQSDLQIYQAAAGAVAGVLNQLA